MMSKAILSALTNVFLGLVLGASAEITMSTVVGNDMVVQGKQKLPIWGWAEPGEKVTVSFNNREKTAIADDVFYWKVEFEPMDYARTPLTMHITGSSGDAITFENILIGEVWVGSGQSNMERALHTTARGEEFIKTASDPLMRLYTIWRKVSTLPQITSIDSEWKVCSPDTARGFSAVLYYFGLRLRRELDVPVGLIAVPYSGTSIQPWIPLRGFRSRKDNKAFQLIADGLEAGAKAHSDNLERSLGDVNIDFWLRMNEACAKKGQSLVELPMALAPVSYGYGNLFNAMVNPVIPFGVKGVIWYQGESNVNADNRKGLYGRYMKALIEGWRECWEQESLSFYLVQLTPRDYSRLTKDPLKLPQLWENQLRVLSLPETGIASTFDVSPVEGACPEEAHPKRKYEIGCRLSLLALAKNYGKTDIEYSGPVYRSHEVEGNAIRVSFDHVGGGLRSRNQQPLDWFTIAGQDKQFVRADAEINHDTVIASSPDIAEPVAVRFGWHQLAVPNLMNKEGLPALPFRTDKW